MISFRARHNLSLKQICGESKDIPDSDVEKWMNRISTLIDGYAQRDIFNCDETGLFFRELPTKTLTEKAKACFGGKHSKERLTLLLCCNMKGEMEKPLVIGKSRKPRCFKNIDVSNLPVIWKSQRKAWNTAVIIEEWLKLFNRKMQRDNRHVLLFLDNAPCHPEIELTNVKLHFLPANTTSRTQPLDQGIIKTLKTVYKKYFLRSILAAMGTAKSASELAKTVTILDAIKWIDRASKEITPDAIIKCFKKSGFSFDIEEISDSNKDDVEKEELQDLMNNISGFIPDGKGHTNVTEYIHGDDELTTSDYNDSVDFLIAQKLEDNSGSSTDEYEVEDEVTSIKSYQEALKNIKLLQNFYIERNNYEMIPMLTEIQCATEKEAIKKKK